MKITDADRAAFVVGVFVAVDDEAPLPPGSSVNRGWLPPWRSRQPTGVLP